MGEAESGGSGGGDGDDDDESNWARPKRNHLDDNEEDEKRTMTASRQKGCSIFKTYLDNMVIAFLSNPSDGALVVMRRRAKKGSTSPR